MTWTLGRSSDGLSGFAVDLGLRDFFFDRAAVLDRLSEANHKALSKSGAFVRRRARTRLRRRKRVSGPGESPSVHTTDRTATLKNILFALDPSSDSVVIGPVRLNQVNNAQLPDGSFAIRGTVPELLEFGGAARIFEWDLQGNGDWSRADRRFTRTLARWKNQGVLHQRTRIRRATYAPRPFMGPALAAAAESGEIASGWSGVLRSS